MKSLNMLQKMYAQINSIGVNHRLDFFLPNDKLAIELSIKKITDKNPIMIYSLLDASSRYVIISKAMWDVNTPIIA